MTSPPSLPFAHLNLRRNPFGEIDRSTRAELAVVDVGAYVSRLVEPGYAVQFLGEKGRGKTTHLLAIGRHFPQAVYVHISEDRRPRVPRGRPLLIDELQRLPRWRRRLVYRRKAPLVIGTHIDYAQELRRAGYEVDTVVLDGMLDDARLESIVNMRIGHFRRGAGPVPRVRPETVRALLDRYGDDVRAIEAHLYERFQELRELGDV
jgi:hypothetical protein